MICFDAVSGLEFLHTEQNLMHRDVKPSNILASRDGRVVICDFGIAGKLVNSHAMTVIGCKPYMAPERINPKKDSEGYGVRSDVWSLGITVYELATGKYPYSKWKNQFQQMEEVVDGVPPHLPPPTEDPTYTIDVVDFVAKCLNKSVDSRPKYQDLLNHAFLKKYSGHGREEIAQFFQEVLDAENTPRGAPEAAKHNTLQPQTTA